MSTKPILFSTPMVQAILDGRKTMTRRVIPELSGKDAWSEGRYKCLESPPGKVVMGEHFTFRYREDSGAFQNEYVPLRYRENDILWVRETWCNISDWTCVDPSVGLPDGFIYKADWHARLEHPRWRPSIYMPREAARLFLRVTDVRAEKLQSITAEDGKREGVCGLCYNTETGEEDYDITLFKVLWNGLNAKRGYGWDANPWVWVIEFERIEKP